MRRKRWISILLVFLLGSLFLQQDGMAASQAPPPISAQTAALIDVQSGRILAEKNGDKRMRIASLTKIMTAIVAIEQGNVNDIVKTSDNAYRKEGSSIYLKQGEKMKLEDMLYGLMLRSGNDAAVAIAEHVGGSVEGFAKLMNEKAAYIGMTHTNFTNPHGLDDSNNHYSTASDMARLTAYALKNPIFKKIVSTQVKAIPNEGEAWDRKLLNKNKMLRLYEGADGVKTGYTKIAKRCLASSATRNGQQLAIVVLNAPSDWDDSMKWMDYGFANYPLVPLIKEKQRVKEEVKGNNVTSFYTRQSFSYPLRADEKNLVKLNTVTKDNNPYVEVSLQDTVIGRVPLEAINETMVQAMARRVTDGWTIFWRTWSEVF